jgi:hypothetical protein
LELGLWLRTELGGEAGEGFGWWREALAGAGSGSFEFCSRENAEGAGVAGGEMLLNSLLPGGREFSVDEGVELIRAEMVRVKTLGGQI